MWGTRFEKDDDFSIRNSAGAATYQQVSDFKFHFFTVEDFNRIGCWTEQEGGLEESTDGQEDLCGEIRKFAAQFIFS